MTPKQERFCAEYLIDLNATQAAIRSGYSEKTAYSIGQRLLKNVEVQRYITELRERAFDNAIATIKETEAFLAKCMRGDVKEEVIVTLGNGDGSSRAKVVEKQISLRDRIKAAELIGKRNQLFTDKVKVDGAVPIVIAGEGEILD